MDNFKKCDTKKERKNNIFLVAGSFNHVNHMKKCHLHVDLNQQLDSSPKRVGKCVPSRLVPQHMDT